MSTREIISLGAAANDRNGDTFRSGGEKINNNFLRLWLHLGGDSNGLSQLVTFDSDNIVFEGTSTDAFETRLSAENPTADREVIIPDASGTLVLLGGSQTLEDKTLEDPIVTRLQINDADSSHQYTIVPGNLSADHNLNIPVLTDSDTIVLLAASQTLTNKTLTTPSISSPDISGTLNDVNGAGMIQFSAQASAANNFLVSNAAASGFPSFGAVGTDSDITIAINSKGSGSVRLSKVAYQVDFVNSSGAINPDRSAINFNSGSALAMTLADGTVAGESKKFMNAGAGDVTITPTNFAAATSLTIQQDEACELIWNGATWFLIGNQSIVSLA